MNIQEGCNRIQQLNEQQIIADEIAATAPQKRAPQRCSAATLLDIQ